MTTFRQARLWQELLISGATIEDLARAWSSMDRKEDYFDRDKDMSPLNEFNRGIYEGYITEMEEIIARATKYAILRKVGKDAK